MELDKLGNRLPPLWALLLGGAVVWAVGSCLRGLWEPDEARYAYVAWEMRHCGNWLVPRLYGEPYPDKPPLLFWLINLAASLTGGAINGFSARLPSLVGSVMTLWFTTRLIGAWRNPRAAWRVAFVLASSFLFWREGAWGRIDALLCGIICAGVYFFFRSRERRPSLYLALAYLSAGFAMLAKGPVGLAVPLGIYAAAECSSGNSASLKRAHWLWGIPLALTLPAAWLAMAWLNGVPRDYFIEMLTTKSFARVVKESGHNNPVYYYAVMFPLEFMPWTCFLLAALRAAPNEVLRRRLAGWFLFVIVFFSLFVCKRGIYVLAAYPAAAMLIAAYWDEIAGLSRAWTRSAVFSATAITAALALAEIGAVFFSPRQVQLPAWRLLSCAATASAASVAAFTLSRKGLTDRWLFVFSGLMLAHYIALSTLALPELDSVKTPRAEAAKINERLQPGRPVYLFKQQLAILPLYAGRMGRALRSDAELRNLLRQKTRCVVVFDAARWRELAPDLKARASDHYFVMGSKKLVWAEFNAEAEPPPN